VDVYTPPPQSGWDSLARYLLGFAQPTVSDARIVRRFLQATFDTGAAEDFQSVTDQLWPHSTVAPPATASRPSRWRLTERGVSEAITLLEHPQDSWRRGLSRTVILCLLAADAVPRGSSPKATAAIGRFGSPLLDATAKTPGGWLDSPSIQRLATTMLHAAESGDPILSAYTGVRDPIKDLAVGRVLWRLRHEGLVREQTTSPQVGDPPLPIPGDLRMQLRHRRDAQLTPLGRKLLSVRRRSAQTPTDAIRLAKNVARTLLKHPNPQIAALSIEHVVKIPDIPDDPLQRRIDLALWTPTCPPEQPSTWVEIVRNPATSWSAATRLPTHLARAALASSLWAQHIDCYVVLSPADRALAALEESIAHTRQDLPAGTSLFIHAVNIKAATTRTLLEAPKLLTARLVA